jgi:DNA-binding beta-propeller fold protein YncE
MRNQIIKTIPSPVAAARDLCYTDFSDKKKYEASCFDGLRDGPLLWVSCFTDGTIKAIDVQDGRVVRSFPSPATAPGGICFADGYFYITDSTTNLIYIVDPTGRVVRSCSGLGPTILTTSAIAYIGGGRFLVVDGSAEPSPFAIGSIRGSTFRLEKIFTGKPVRRGAAFDGNHLLIGSRDTNSIKAYDPEGNEVKSYPIAIGTLDGLAWCEDLGLMAYVVNTTATIYFLT